MRPWFLCYLLMLGMCGAMENDDPSPPPPRKQPRRELGPSPPIRYQGRNLPTNLEVDLVETVGPDLQPDVRVRVHISPEAVRVREVSVFVIPTRPAWMQAAEGEHTASSSSGANPGPVHGRSGVPQVEAPSAPNAAAPSHLHQPESAPAMHPATGMGLCVNMQGGLGRGYGHAAGQVGAPGHEFQLEVATTHTAPSTIRASHILRCVCNTRSLAPGTLQCCMVLPSALCWGIIPVTRKPCRTRRWSFRHQHAQALPHRCTLGSAHSLPPPKKAPVRTCQMREQVLCPYRTVNRWRKCTANALRSVLRPFSTPASPVLDQTARGTQRARGHRCIASNQVPSESITKLVNLKGRHETLTRKHYPVTTKSRPGPKSGTHRFLHVCL